MYQSPELLCGAAYDAIFLNCCSARSQSCSCSPCAWPRCSQYCRARNAISSCVGTYTTNFALPAAPSASFATVFFVPAAARGFAVAFFAAFSFVSAIAVTPFAAIAFALLRINLRIRKPGVEIQSLHASGISYDTDPLAKPSNLDPCPSNPESMSRSFAMAGLLLAQHKHQRNHAHAEDRKDGDDAQVGQHRRLPAQLVVDERLRHMRIARHLPAKAARCCIASPVKHPFQPVHLVAKGLIARREVLRHHRLVVLRPSRQHGRDQRRSRGPADIARQVHNAGDVVRLLARHAYIADRVDRDEQERQPRGLELSLIHISEPT